MAHKIFQTYLRRLTNLSGNNKSLLLLRLSATQDLDLHRLDYLTNQPSFMLINQLIAGKEGIVLCDVADSRNATVNEVSQHLKRIDRQEKTIWEERGARDLYVGWPFVHGKFSDGTPVRCPLLFVPVRLSIHKQKWMLHVRENEAITFNKSFLLAYSFFNKTKPDENLLEENFESFPEDILEFRTALYELLKEANLEVNFNRDLFLNTLCDFTAYKRADYEELHGTGQLKLQPEAVLGLFPQADSYLVPDYNLLMELSDSISIESLLGAADEEQLLRTVREDNIYTAFPLDGSQENALRHIKSGRSLVVQGPPGTGKSQLICNLIGDAIASGKRVLLVSQKRAALDVVYERLQTAGLTPFTALVHDFKSDRKDIFAKVAYQIEQIDEYRKRNNNLDAIHLERSFSQVSKLIDQLVAQLNQFKHALFDTQEAGTSIKELYLTSDPHAPSVSLKDNYRFFRVNELGDFMAKLNRFFAYAPDFEEKDYPWRDRKSFARLSFSDRKALQQILAVIPDTKKIFEDRTAKILIKTTDLKRAAQIYSHQKDIDRLLLLLSEPSVYTTFRYLVENKISVDNLADLKADLYKCFEREGMEVSLPAERLEEVSQSLAKAIEASGGSFDWYRWTLFSGQKKMLTEVFVQNKLLLEKETLHQLEERLRNRIEFEEVIKRIRNTPGLINVPDSLDAEDFENWFFMYEKTLLATAIFRSLPDFEDNFNISELAYDELRLLTKELMNLCRSLISIQERWQQYLTPDQVYAIWDKTDIAKKLSKQVEIDFEALVEYDKLLDSLLPHESDALYEIYRYLVMTGVPENMFPAQAPAFFLNSLRLAWIEHIEEKYPLLRSVSSKALGQMQVELQSYIEEKRKISREILLLRAREHTYQTIQYNRLQNRTTYRELHHQVTKKKRIWPLRKLIDTQHEEIFNLVPCWMASPEAVSAVFPMREMFDLVIFDEASQCYAEKSIPALFRAKQVLIAGDSKQLQPNNLYQARWEDEEAEEVALEVDSILNLASLYLPQTALTEHYRSRSLDLIDFSNHHFYKNKLRLLPDYAEINRDEPGIDYIRVKGVWKNNTNRLEAEAIVALVLDLLDKQNSARGEEASIGIVTFNSRQQTLILDLLEEAASTLNVRLPESLFVKNIENVQGDERDIIIFSIGYAPDENGKLQLHFGPLNGEGGENRLNVAITRARLKVYVVCSLKPEQLKVENTLHEGPKLLKSYLHYALDVSERRFRPRVQKPEISAEWLLKSRLLNEHKALALDLPFADLTVKTYHRYRALVLTDDDLYYTSASVKDAHAYTPMSLQQKNWKFIRLYSREYWADKRNAVNKLCSYIDTELSYKTH